MSDKKTYQQEEQIRRYLQNEMTGAKRNAFEREMQKDPFLEDAVDGLSNFSAEKIIADINLLKTEIQKGRRSNRRYIWYAAASVLVILVSTFMLFNLEQKTNPVLTENIRKVEPEPQKEIIQEPQHLRANDTEQKIVTIEDSEDLEVKNEIVVTEAENAENISIPVENKSIKSAFTPNLTEQMKLKKSFDISENLKMAKVESQQKVASEETNEKLAATNPLALMQTVSNTSYQKVPAKSSAMRIASVDRQENETKSISGVVTDTSGLPLPGVTVVIKGTTEGTITDINGNYFIPNVQDSSSLVYSFVGMKTQEIPAVNKAQIDISMPADDIALSEVVAVGYGVQIKKDMTSSVSGIETTNIGDRKATPSRGWKAYKEYLESGLQHPAIGSPDKKVVVVISFVVDERGSIGSFKILRSNNDKYNKTAIDIITEGPGWSPTVKDSILQKEEVKMRLVFPSVE